jgi:Spy/CpxP family protein refolding chaperone
MNMNRNTIYVAVFTVLCVLVGVLIGAEITRNTILSGARAQGQYVAGKSKHLSGDLRKRPKERKASNSPFDKLSLSEAQKSKAEDIMQKTRSEISAVVESMRANISMVTEKGNEQFIAILTPEQREKFQALQKESKGCRECKRNSEGVGQNK